MQSAPAAFPFLLSSTTFHSTENKLSCPLLSLVHWCIHGIQTLCLASLNKLDSFNPCSQTNPSGLCNYFSFSPSSLPSRIIPVYGPFPRLLPAEGERLLRGKPAEQGWQPIALAHGASRAGRPPACCLSCCLPVGEQAAKTHVEKRPVTSITGIAAGSLQHPPSALPNKPLARELRGWSGTSAFAEKILGKGE